MINIFIKKQRTPIEKSSWSTETKDWLKTKGITNIGDLKGKNEITWLQHAPKQIALEIIAGITKQKLGNLNKRQPQRHPRPLTQKEIQEKTLTLAQQIHPWLTLTETGMEESTANLPLKNKGKTIETIANKLAIKTIGQLALHQAQHIEKEAGRTGYRKAKEAVAKEIHQHPSKTAQPNQYFHDIIREGFRNLLRQQQQIILLKCTGRTWKEIGNTLHNSPSTTQKTWKKSIEAIINLNKTPLEQWHHFIKQNPSSIPTLIQISPELPTGLINAILENLDNKVK